MNDDRARGTDTEPFIHPTATVDEGARVGHGSRIWHFSHVMPGAEIGRDVVIGQNGYVGGKAKIGARTRIQNGVSVFDGVELGEDVFVGPAAVFTNVRTPRAFVDRKAEIAPTRVGRGATIGAGATIVCGNDVGEHAFVGAGAVVTKPVAAFALVMGNPARRVGWVSRRGHRLPDGERPACPETGEIYLVEGEQCRPAEPDATHEPRSRIELADLRALHEPLRARLRAAFDRVTTSGRFVLGREVADFEARAAEALGVPHAVGVSSGTDAILASLMALEIGPGDEVITTPFSFFASVGAVVRLGATPVFADVDDDLTLSADALEAVVTPRTRAILPVHLFGRPVDPRVFAFARDRGLAVVEDAAQAFGATTPEGPVGALGDLGAFSFFPTKNLGALGDGGLVTTRDPEMAERLKMLRSQGASPKYHYVLLGGNFRLDALQAALLAEKLPFAKGWTEQRRRNAATYDEIFRACGLGGPGTALTLPRASSGHAFHQYVVRTPRRDALRAHLDERGIGTEVYYPEPLHLQPCLSHLPYRPGSMPRAERASLEALALPVHPTLTQSQVERVAGEVVSFLRG
jgi:dTDP-4-amino-4,6-dideoxygalactose transaminase/acetyltransferase-like isoleucine patch superfamily enzyme